jgi:hypothetical protein
MATGMHLRLSKSIRASDNCAADLRGCDRDHAKLGSRSPCEDERFLGRCGVIVPWSWTIVCIFEIKSGSYPKVSNPSAVSRRISSHAKLSIKNEAAKAIDLKHWTALRRRFLARPTTELVRAGLIPSPSRETSIDTMGPNLTLQPRGTA